MITHQEVLDMKKFYVDYMKSVGRLTPAQEKTLEGLEFKFVQTNGGYSGMYNLDSNIFEINLGYNNRYVLEQTVFHELDHARVSYYDGLKTDKDGNLVKKRNTGAFLDDSGLGIDKNGNMVGSSRGEMLGEGVTALNGEKVYHAFKGDSDRWIEEPNQTADMNLFPEHKFPSGVWWYKLNANFISQIASVFGVHEDVICKTLDKGKEGRRILSTQFRKFSNRVTLEDFEQEADSAASLAKCALSLGADSINEQEYTNAGLSIDIAQLLLVQLLQDAYTNNQITQKEYMQRHNNLLRYATSAYVRETMKEGLITTLRQSGVQVRETAASQELEI